MRFSTTSSFSFRIVAFSAAVLLAGCKGGEPIAPYAGPPISQLVRQVSSTGGPVITATVVPGPPPAPGTGPALTVEGVAAIINGGSTPVRLSSTAPMERVYLEARGYDGYWDVTLPSGTTAQDLVLTMADTLPASATRFSWRSASGGVVSPVVQQSVRSIRVGSGDVQVSVAWTGASDVDLWAISPANDTIYFGNKTGTSGGRLDLDSNPACNIDNTNNENIVWPRGGAPRGTYRVQVRYFSACNATRSDYVVTAVVAGRQPQIFSGSFVGPAGSANPPVNALTFTY